MARIKAPHDVNWNAYYEKAEPDAEAGWNFIRARLADYDIDMSVVLDFACGRGRIAEKSLALSDEMILCDISEEAIDFCRRRFPTVTPSAKIRYVVNTETKIPIDDSSVSFLYSWDAMVHFGLKSFSVYMKEFRRVLRRGGHGFIHHANFGSLDVRMRLFLRHFLIRTKRSGFYSNPHCRSGISAMDIRELCEANELEVLRQELIDWGTIDDRPYGRVENLDCITIFKKL